MEIAIYILSGFCIAATLIPILQSSKWYIRGFDFPHAQISFLTLVALIAALIFFPIRELNIPLVMGLLGCFIYQFRIIYPYTPLANKQVLTDHHPGQSIKLLSCNVFMDNRQVDRCLSLVTQYDPDLLLLVETNQWWYEQTSHLKDFYPYVVDCPLENTYGMILYSKKKLLDARILFLVEEDVPSIHTLVEFPQGKSIMLHCIHPAPPSPTENETAVERDAELLIVAKMIDANNFPTIVMGDLNDVAWSSTTRLFQRISGLLDPRIGRGFVNTFHVSFPLLRWPLDHVFHSSHFKLVRLQRGGNIGSDHFPICIHLSIDQTAPAQQQEPQADSEDLKLANEKINGALDSP